MTQGEPFKLAYFYLYARRVDARYVTQKINPGCFPQRLMVSTTASTLVLKLLAEIIHPTEIFDDEAPDAEGPERSEL